MPRPKKIWGFNAISYQTELAVDPQEEDRLVLSHKSERVPYWQGVSLDRDALEKLHSRLGAWLYAKS